MLEIAKAIILREQDIATREHDVARRRHELETKERDLRNQKGELEQLRLDFSAAARGQALVEPSEPESASLVESERPPLARANATVAQRVLALLEMEPRALSPLEIFNLLELPPPIETLRTTLWKMEKHQLIARPFPGHYCALQYEADMRRSTQTG